MLVNETMSGDRYYRYISTKNNEDLYLLVFGHEKCRPCKTENALRSKTHFVIHYILSGHGEFTYNGVRYALGSGDTFYIPPSAPFTYMQDADDPWEYIWFEFGGLRAKQLCESALYSEQAPIYHCRDEKIQLGILDLLNSPKNQLALELNSLSHLYKFLAQVIEERCPDRAGKLSAKQKTILLAEKYIMNNYANSELNLHMISNALYIAPSYLSRIFKEITGLNLSKFIISTRLQKACELLEYDDYPVKNIASMVGYTDPCYFTTEFKKHIGCSPSQYTSHTNSHKKGL